MIDIREFIDFVEKERLAQEAELQNRDILSIRALVSLGKAISDLRIVGRFNDNLLLDCSDNRSRFRPGDRLIFRHELLPSFKATLYDLKEQGRRLHVRGSKLPGVEEIGGWLAVEDTTDLTYSVQSALRKLQPGVPGWSFVKSLLGQSSLPDTVPDTSRLSMLEEMVLETGLVLDESQRDVILRCLTLPSLLGVQGPPGTGKTLVLAFVAEALERLGKRAVLLAPTHQAINNVLTTIRQLFPKRKVKKYGDELHTESLDAQIPIVTSPLMLSKEPVDTIIGFTFMSALHHLMISDQKMVLPNVVIVDEAGQLPVAQGICTGLSGAGSILFFGDDKQMPPVIVGDLSEEPLAISIFSQLRKTQPHAIQMLNTTYRLNERLCKAISTVFYVENADASLRPSERAAHRLFPMTITDPSGGQAIQDVLARDVSLVWLQVPSRNCSQFNHAEAQAAANIVVSCLKAGMSSHEIAVVTPFRRQVMYIRHLIAGQIGEEQELPIVDTVERVQGLTVEAVIVSFCASEKDYIAAIGDFLFSPNRLNVAVSRARTKAIVISSPQIFDVLPKTYSALQARTLCQNFFSSCDCVSVFD